MIKQLMFLKDHLNRMRHSKHARFQEKDFREEDFRKDPSLPKQRKSV